MAAEKAWTGKTGGTPWMQRALIRIFARIDNYWFYPVVAVWILFYMLFQPAGTRGIYYYWHRRRGLRPLAAAHHLYWTYFRFGTVILDRFSAYAGRRYPISIDGEEFRQEMEHQEGGSIVISSHIGNQEQAGYAIRTAKPMRVLTYMGDTATVNQNRERMFAEMGLSFIPLQSDGSHIFAMHEAIEHGETLSIHGDRMFFGGRTLRGTILGEPADFPEGPYKVAAIEGVPVYTMFMMKEHGHRYKLYVRRLADGTEQGTTREKSQRLLDAFIREAETVLSQYPHQWFHFYNFWQPQAVAE